MEAWIGGVFALGGVAVGALAESLRSKATFWRERRWERQQESRRRIEELYTAIENIHHRTSVHTTEAILALTTGALDMKLEGPLLPYSKVAMIVGLYLPALATHVDALFAARDAMASALLTCISGRAAGANMKEEALTQLRAASHNFAGVCDGFRKALADAAHSHDLLLEAGGRGKDGGA